MAVYRRVVASVHANDWTQSEPVDKRGLANGSFAIDGPTGLSNVQVFVGTNEVDGGNSPPTNWAGARFANGQVMVLPVDSGTHLPMPDELKAVGWIKFGPYGDDTPGQIVCEFVG